MSNPRAEGQHGSTSRAPRSRALYAHASEETVWAKAAPWDVPESDPHRNLAAMDMGTLLALLPVIEADIERDRAQLRECVALLRARRASWREIGDALSVTRQAAWERFQPADGD